MDGCFFGFEIDEVGAGCNPVPFLFKPLSNLDFGNAFANGRNDDLGHVKLKSNEGIWSRRLEYSYIKAYSNRRLVSPAVDGTQSRNLMFLRDSS